MAALMRMLTSIQRCQPRNEHMESMAMSLSTPIGEQGMAMVPVDFIGAVEHLEDDFFDMLNQSGRITKLDSSQIMRIRTTLRSTDDLHLTSEPARRLKKMRTPALDELVAHVYAQDFICFGYRNATVSQGRSLVNLLR